MRLMFACVCLAAALGMSPAVAEADPGARLLTLSPDGQRLAYEVGESADARVIVQSLAGEALTKVELDGAQLHALTWAGDTHLLVRVGAHAALSGPADQGDLEEVFSFNVLTGKRIRIFERNEKIYPAVLAQFGAAQVGGHWYGFFGGVTMPSGGRLDPQERRAFGDLYQVDLDSGVDQRLAVSGGLDRRWVVDASGAILAHADYQPEARSWKLYAGADQARLIAHQDELGQAPVLDGQGRSPASVVVQGVEWRLSDGQPSPLTDAAGPTLVLHDPESGRAVGVALIGAPITFRFFDPAVQARYQGIDKALGPGVSVASWSRGFERWVVRAPATGPNAGYWLIDGTSAKKIDLP